MAYVNDIVITLRYEWDMGHRLPLHTGRCRRLHGHRYVVEVSLRGPIQIGIVPTNGMVEDFGDVKDLTINKIGEWDHRTMLWDGDALCQELTYQLQQEYGIFRVSFMPTAENIAEDILLRLHSANSRVVRVRVYETPNCWAEAYK